MLSWPCKGAQAAGSERTPSYVYVRATGRVYVEPRRVLDTNGGWAGSFQSHAGSIAAPDEAWRRTSVRRIEQTCLSSPLDRIDDIRRALISDALRKNRPITAYINRPRHTAKGAALCTTWRASARLRIGGGQHMEAPSH